MTDEQILEIAGEQTPYDLTSEEAEFCINFARALLAAGASGGQASRLQRAVWEVERPDHDGFYWLWRISYKGERMPAEIVQRHQGDFLFPGDSKAFAANSTVFVGAYWLPACIAPQPDASAELTALRERIAGMEKDAERWRAWLPIRDHYRWDVCSEKEATQIVDDTIAEQKETKQ